jgi:hypothetical protein
MMPRQSGKNEIAAALVAFLLRTHAVAGGTVVVCAPTREPQARISAERIRGALAATDALVPAAGRSRSRGDTVTVGHARAVLLSASPQANVAGHTASIALVADEAQDIDEAWFNRQFRPMAASTGAPTILLGTAWDGRTLLERAVEANRARDAVAPHGPRHHHQASWREVAETLPAYGAYVEAERERLGASHPLFLSQYELVPGEVAGRLLTRELLASLEGGHDPLSAPEPGERYVAGLDFGGDGESADATVLTIARVEADGGHGSTGCAVVGQREWRGEPYARVLDDIRALDRAWRFDRVSGDATRRGWARPSSRSCARSSAPASTNWCSPPPRRASSATDSWPRRAREGSRSRATTAAPRPCAAARSWRRARRRSRRAGGSRGATIAATTTTSCRSRCACAPPGRRARPGWRWAGEGGSG